MPQKYLLGRKKCFDNLEKWDLNNNGSEQNQITKYKASGIKVLEEHLLPFAKPQSYKSRQVIKLQLFWQLYN